MSAHWLRYRSYQWLCNGGKWVYQSPISPSTNRLRLWSSWLSIEGSICKQLMLLLKREDLKGMILDLTEKLKSNHEVFSFSLMPNSHNCRILTIASHREIWSHTVTRWVQRPLGASQHLATWHMAYSIIMKIFLFFWEFGDQIWGWYK